MKRTIYIALLVLLSLAGYYMLSPHNKLTFASLLGEEDSLIAIIETPQIETATAEPMAEHSPTLFCYNKEEALGPEIETDEGKSRTSYKVNLKMNLAGIAPAALAGVKEALGAFLSNGKETHLAQAVNWHGDSVSCAYKEDITFILDNNEIPNAHALDYYYEVDGSPIDDHHPDALGYAISFEAFQGGAHGSYFQTWMALDAATGARITASQAFDLTKQDELLNAIRAKLCEDNKCQTIEQLRDSTGLLDLGDVFVHDDNFALGRQGVTFLYNPYDIACWAVGSCTVTVPYTSLRGLCRYASK